MTSSATTEVDAWSADLYNSNASFVYSKQFTSAVLSLLDPKEGQKILDLGCGSGEITLELQNIVGGTGLVVGSDFSPNMVSGRVLEGSFTD